MKRIACIFVVVWFLATLAPVNVVYAAVPPEVSTVSATNVTDTTATLNGYLDFDPADYRSVDVIFDYGPTTDYGYLTWPQGMYAPGPFYWTITGLAPGTTYHFRARIGISYPFPGDVVATDMTFTTGGLLPNIVTNMASDVTTNSAELNGGVTSLGSLTGFSMSFEYGTTPTYGATTEAKTASGLGDVHITVSGLTPRTIYNYRVRAHVGTGVWIYGINRSFRTEALPLSVVTDTAGDVTHDSAILNGTLTGPGDNDTVELSFEWGLTSNDYTATTPIFAANSPGPFSFLLSDLAPNTIYHYRAKAVGNATVYGIDQSFTTLPLKAPGVSTLNAADVTTVSATLMGFLLDAGTSDNPITVSFQWGQAADNYDATTPPMTMDYSWDHFGFVLGGLPPGTTYHYRAKAVGDGTAYGLDRTFTTARVVQSIAVSPAGLSVSQSQTIQFVATGTYSDSSKEDLTALVTWVSSNAAVATIAAGTGISQSISPGTTNIIATLGSLTSSTILTVTSSSLSVSTDTSTAVTTISVTLNGILTDYGMISANVSFEWGLTTSYGYRTPEVPMDGTGAFSADLSTLLPGRTYHFRARADGQGTAFGSDKSFTTLLPPLEWSHTFGGTGQDEGSSVQQTSDGGYITSGYTNSFGAGSADVYLVKTDSQGNLTWSRTFGGEGTQGSSSVRQTADGGYIMVGNGYLIKTDSQGNLTWNKTFGGAGIDDGFSVRQTADGGYIIAGRTNSFCGGNGFWAYLIKTDAQGNLTWSRTYGGVDRDEAYSVQQTSDGGYIIAGRTWSFGGDYLGAYIYSDVYLIKTDAQGNTLWSRSFGGWADDWAQSVLQTADGGYIIAGSTYSFGDGYNGPHATDVYLVKTDAQGILIWSKTLGEANQQWGASVQQTSDGGYVVAGVVNSSGNNDVYVVKADSNGNIVWSGSFGGLGYDGANSIQQTSDGGYIVTGYTDSIGAGFRDMWLIKLPAVKTTKIVFTSPDQSLTAGSVSGVVTIQTWDEFNNPANVASATTVALTTTSAVGKFDTSASGPFDGSITSITIPAGGDSASFYYKDTAAGRPILTAIGTGYTTATQQEIINPAATSQIKVETAANGTGTVAGSKTLAAGTSFTVYAVSRDQYDNYVANTAGTWSLTSKTGGVADSDLVPGSDGKSAVFTGNHTGTTRIRTVYGSLAPGDSGIIRVVNYGDANEDGKINMADVTKVERIILGLDPATCACDANGDGNTNMGDVTKIERIILGLDPLVG